jgi:hypothetical protein
MLSLILDNLITPFEHFQDLQSHQDEPKTHL